MNTSVEEILTQRQKTHGPYKEHARVTQTIKSLMHSEGNWKILTVCQRETLDMIAHKIGRILSGDPNVQDHWDDIAGYSTLVSKNIVEHAAPSDIDKSWSDAAFADHQEQVKALEVKEHAVLKNRFVTCGRCIDWHACGSLGMCTNGR